MADPRQSTSVVAYGAPNLWGQVYIALSIDRRMPPYQSRAVADEVEREHGPAQASPADLDLIINQALEGADADDARQEQLP